MILKLNNNRVRRSYLSSGIIDKYTGNFSLNYPEDWIASVVTAFNPGFDKVENEGLSKLEDGRFLKNYIDSNPEVLGTQKNISILVKFLDAGERLVIQGHPTNEFAEKYFNSPYGKTECWYIVDATDDACVYLGFNKTATKEKWIEAFNKQDKVLMLSMLNKFLVKKGDCIFVAGGMPHAIGKGCFLVELQQPTDYMVITEKTTASGMVLDERKIHGGLGYEKMFDCFEYNCYKPDEVIKKYFINHEKENNKIISVINEKLTDKFALDVLYVKGVFEISAKPDYSVIVITDGKGEIKSNDSVFDVFAGDKFFVEANTRIEISSDYELSLCILKP